MLGSNNFYFWIDCGGFLKMEHGYTKKSQYIKGLAIRNTLSQLIQTFGTHLLSLCLHFLALAPYVATISLSLQFCHVSFIISFIIQLLPYVQTYSDFLKAVLISSSCHYLILNYMLSLILVSTFYFTNIISQIR